ncbi:F0F1 ATP synthase subunit B [Clostridium sp. HCP1S3_B4]|uniref:F0F1 ATP synthase subunit B n=1 Tax=unclassified Clostridium TaxID=2614128 RepID=UPI0016A7D362|nr:F0F1 ATP synthase subunit B [Clostridiales bacterium]
MNIDPSVVLATMINFVILLLILKHFFWDKVGNVIKERQDYIESKISQADEDSEKARLYLVENERILRSSKEEGNKIIEAKKEKANKMYDEIVKDANKESKAIMERASLEIQRQKEKAKYELKKEVVDLAIDLSAKAISEKVQEEKQRDLINDFITKVGS